MDTISVIIPVYNGIEYLEKTVESVLNSSYKNLEVILINDGSTDRSYELCLDLKKSDPRIVLINQSNGGIAAARNAGLSAAKGEWIAFCDQDDIVNPYMYELLLKRVLDDQSELGICSTGKLISENIETYEKYPDLHIKNKDVKEKLLYSIMFREFKYAMQGQLFQDNIKLENSIWKCLINRAVIAKYNIRFKKFINYEDDRTFLMELLSVVNSVSLLKDCLYYWRINLNSETYRRKYIDNLPEKMHQYSVYETEIFKRAHVDKNVMKAYFKFERCSNYVLLIENEFGLPNNKTFRGKIQYLSSVIYDQYFAKTIRMKKYLKSNFLKKRLVLFVLSLKLTGLAYIVDITYLNIKRQALKYRFLTRFEQKAADLK